MPTIDELREALRPPNLPLPFPRTVLEAAHRVRDLTAAGRLGEARRIAEDLAGEPAPLADRLQLLAAHADALATSGRGEDAQAVRSEIVGLIAGAGRPEHARAAAAVLLAPGAAGADTSPAAMHSPPADGRAVTRGRRRAALLGIPAGDDVDEVILAVLRGALVPAPTGHEDHAELLLAEGRLISALEALQEARPRMVGDLEPILRIRYGQVLLELERPEQAAAQAQQALALAVPERPREEHSADRGGADQHGTSQNSDVRQNADPHTPVDRTAIAARAVLARALRPTDPAAAARAATDALIGLLEVDDAPARIAVMTDLLHALIAAQRPAEGAYTARRLASMLRTVTESQDRVPALLAVAEHHIRAGQDPDAALPMLLEVRRLSRRSFDHRASLAAGRMLVSVHGAAGRTPETLDELRRVAADARSLGDDLAASPQERARHLRTELGARAAVLRLAVETSDRATVEAEAAAVLRRTRPGGRAVLAEDVLWENAVDARLARLIATGMAWAVGSADAPREVLEERRAEVRSEIAAAPPGAARRSLFWEAYLADRESMIFASAGETDAALDSAREAHAAWERIGEAAHAQRIAAEIDRLETLEAEADTEAADAPDPDGTDTPDPQAIDAPDPEVAGDPQHPDPASR